MQLYRYYWRRIATAVARSKLATEDGNGVRPSCFRFSLRALLFAMTMVALACAAAVTYPHILVLVLALVTACQLTRVTTRKAIERRLAAKPHARMKLAAFSVATVGAWLGFYVLLAPPVLVFIEWMRVSDDVRMAIGLTVYRPLTWLESISWVFDLPGVRWYFKSWEHL